MLFEEFVAKEIDAKRFDLKLAPIDGKALLHGHCHQKSFAVMGPVQKVLKAVPGLNVELIESSCCGMAGSFGYQAETIDVSLKMAELSLLPAVRKAPADTTHRRRRHVVPQPDRGRHQAARRARRHGALQKHGRPNRDARLRSASDPERAVEEGAVAAAVLFCRFCIERLALAALACRLRPWPGRPPPS